MNNWVRFEPKLENDGTRYAWNLVIEFDNDWQDWSLESSHVGLVRFTLHLADEMIPVLKKALGESKSYGGYYSSAADKIKEEWRKDQM